MGASPRTGGPLRAESHAFLLQFCFGSSDLPLVFLHLLLFLPPRLRVMSRSKRFALPHSAISSATTSLRNSWDAPAQELLQDVLGMQVSKATARRATLVTGEAALVVCEAEMERLKQEGPQGPAGAEKQAISGDGAFVHLVGGEWAEVKTLALGEVTRTKRGEVCTQHLSYFSRLSDAERFEEAALVETHRRGLEQATAVCAVQDGAEWLQGLVDYHRADAVRILDAGACRRIRQ